MDEEGLYAATFGAQVPHVASVTASLEAHCHLGDPEATDRLRGERGTHGGDLQCKGGKKDVFGLSSARPRR